MYKYCALIGLFLYLKFRIIMNNIKIYILIISMICRYNYASYNSFKENIIGGDFNE